LRLYEMPILLAGIEQDLAESAGELTPEIEARIENFAREGAEKLEAVQKWRRNLEAQATAAGDEAQRLHDRAASF
jgi:hypothetical protein